MKAERISLVCRMVKVFFIYLSSVTTQSALISLAWISAVTALREIPSTAAHYFRCHENNAQRDNCLDRRKRHPDKAKRREPDSTGLGINHGVKLPPVFEIVFPSQTRTSGR